MLRTILLTTAVAVTAATASCALAQEAPLESVSQGIDELAEASPPPFEPSFEFLFFRGLVGELIGALPGALIATMGSLALCNGEGGWISGFTCGAGIGYGATIGAFSGVPLGAAIGMHHASSSRGYDGNFGWALLAAYGGLAIGAGVTASVIALYDEPTWAAIAGGAVSIVFASIFGSLAYRAGVPSPRTRRSSALLAPQLAVGPDGASLGLWGAW